MLAMESNTNVGHAKIIRPIRLHTTIPEDIRAKMDVYLYSDVEGRVPKGAYQEFLVGLVMEFFNKMEKRNADPGTSTTHQ